MSAMSASSGPGLLPLSLISEHKAAQGGPPPAVQPLPRTPDKHPVPVVQAPAPAPKPTPNGMEPSPPIVPPLPIPDHQPSLPCGGKDTEEVSGGGDKLTEDGPAPVEPPASEVAAVPVEEAVPPPVSVEPPVMEPAAAPIEQVDEAGSAAAGGAPEQPAPAEPAPVPPPAAVAPPPALEKVAQEELPPTPAPAPLPAKESSPAPAPPASHSRPPKRTKHAPGINRNAESKKSSEATTPPENNRVDENEEDDRKSKRKRLPTQMYQSPIPELNLIAKITKKDLTPAKNNEEKLIVFYRNEFLAVRNAEGGYYVCQAMQNVFKSSSKIRIRWLSQEPNSDVYTPDFYDNTEFDCILTNLNLERLDKNKYRLPEEESQRTNSILKRAIDVEKGLAAPEETSVTEEHPDGLDLSLYRNEDQLKRRKRKSKKNNEKSEDSEDDETSEKRTSTRRKKRRKIAKGSTVKRVGRPPAVKVDKPVVQRIVAAKQGGKRKGGSQSGTGVKVSGGGASSAVKGGSLKKKEAPTRTGTKRKSEPAAPSPAPAAVQEKRAKRGQDSALPTASKTKSGVAGGPSSSTSRRRTPAK